MFTFIVHQNESFFFLIPVFSYCVCWLLLT